MQNLEPEARHVVNTFNTYAEAYENRFMDMGSYEPSLVRFANLLQAPDCTLFEIGCGPGNITKFLYQRMEQLDILAIDIAEAMVKRARKNVPMAEIKQMDCRDIFQIKPQFNAIVCGFCLPYLDESETEKLIEEITRLLIPGGWLYLSTMSGDYSDSRPYPDSRGQCEPVMTYFHEKDKLIEGLKSCGFSLIVSEILPQKHQYEASKGDLIIIAKKRES